MEKLIIAILLLPALLWAQESSTSYVESIAEHRATYKASFLKDERSPLKEGDLEHLRFFDADEKYRVKCTFQLTPDEKPFDLPTYSGITKPYRKYGVLTFQLDGKEHSVAVYQSLKHIRHPIYKNHLFLPYRDLTNDETTYGGGRYIDMLISEVGAGEVYLDFNKSYHPWCHYSDGYNCPIPPAENHLDVEILAGEKMYVGEKKHRKKK